MQLKVLKEATKSGERGLIWFGDFAISIPHIKSVYLESRIDRNMKRISSPKPSQMSKEDRVKMLAKLKDMREKNPVLRKA